MVGADVVKNEITAHGMAVLQYIPDAQTILKLVDRIPRLYCSETGGIDFAMNTVCAAGTGSFLDRQAARLAYPFRNSEP